MIGLNLGRSGREVTCAQSKAPQNRSTDEAMVMPTQRFYPVELEFYACSANRQNVSNKEGMQWPFIHLCIRHIKHAGEGFHQVARQSHLRSQNPRTEPFLLQFRQVSEAPD